MFPCCDSYHRKPEPAKGAMNLSLNEIKWALGTREWQATLAGEHEWLPGSYRAHPRDLPGSAGGASAPAAIAACTDVAGPV